MNGLKTKLMCVATVLALCASSLAKGSYSSGGGRSYSSHSSHSSSSGGGHSYSSGGSRSSSGPSRSSGGGGSKSFTSGSGKSYGAASKSSDNGHSYTATKSYSSGSGHNFSSGGKPASPASPASPNQPSRQPNPGSSDFKYDTAAARARKEEASKDTFSKYKESQSASGNRTPSSGGSYAGKPPPIQASRDYSYRRTTYVPDTIVIRDRPARIYHFYSPYWGYPTVYYHDPYNSFFWWWLLDRTLDEQAWWAYHHRYDMDPARYDALLAHDRQLEARVSQLESQQTPRDPNYVPQGVDRDLMYSDQYINQAYHNRPTNAGRVAFWVIGVPAAAAACGFFIWLIWFKRWQTGPAG